MVTFAFLTSTLYVGRAWRLGYDSDSAASAVMAMLPAASTPDRRSDPEIFMTFTCSSIQWVYLNKRIQTQKPPSDGRNLIELLYPRLKFERLLEAGRHRVIETPLNASEQTPAKVSAASSTTLIQVRVLPSLNTQLSHESSGLFVRAA
jgi:hypothetical protein